MNHPTNTILSTIERFKKNRSRFYLMPLESTISLPIPLLLTSNSTVFLALFGFNGKKSVGDKRIKLFRPHTKFVIKYPSGEIAFYQNYTVCDEFSTKNWNEPIGEFPHKAIEALTLKEYTKRRTALLQSYDAIIPLFMKDKHNSELAEEFRQHFYEICEPDLLPFMRKVGKVFFKWVDGFSKEHP